MKYLVGIDIGGMTIKGGIVTTDNQIVAKSVIDTRTALGEDVICQDICDLIHGLIDMAGIEKNDILSVGVGSPGAIDTNKGLVLIAVNLKFNNVYLAQKIEDLVGIKTVVGNDANCAALGEYILRDTTAKSMAMITIGTGFGFGLVLDNKVYCGETYGGGEMGHSTLVFEGEECSCGEKGCVEAYASFTALHNQIDRFIAQNPQSFLANYPKKVEGKELFELAISGNKEAQILVDRFLVYIGQTVVNIINIFDTGLIIIGGGISKSSDYFLPKIIEYVDKTRFCKISKLPEISVATNGNDVAIVGAANLINHI